jgi:hypothetical protein
MLLKCLHPKLWRNSGTTMQNVQFNVQLVLKNTLSFALKFRILIGSLFCTKKVYFRAKIYIFYHLFDAQDTNKQQYLLMEI